MNKISALAFDLDGTLYRGNIPVEGAVEAVKELVNLKYQIFYFTNNSAKTRRQIIRKLNRLGFPAKPENTYSTSYALSEYLSKEGFKDIYLVGSAGLKDELLARNLKIKDSVRVSAVVVGLDPLFSYRKISVASEAIRKGARFIVANIDSSYPVENNKRLPGCGAMVGAIAGAALRQPDFIAGKPNTYMIELLCKEHKLSAQEICIVGDSLESDIKMADSLCCLSILFDQDNVFADFTGNKVKKIAEIISLINKERIGR